MAEIDPELAQRLAQGRDDFHVVGLDTPARVVEEIERVTGRARSRRQPRPSRMYLAQPTLIEQQLSTQRSWGFATAAAVVLLAVGAVGGAILGGRSGPSSPASEPAISVRVPTDAAVPSSRARELDGSVLSAVRPVEPDALAGDDADAVGDRRPRR